MKIDFYEIPENGLTLSVTDVHWFPHDLERQGEVKAILSLKKIGQRVAVSGRITAEVVFECDRCLGKFCYPLDFDFRVDLELPTQHQHNPENADSDHYFRDEEADVDVLDGSEINVTDILQQQLYLALPMKKLCSKECRGICSHCGANLNSEPCRCQSESSSPFSVLTKLKV